MALLVADRIEAAMDKRCANLCSLVALLYQYKVVHSDLICDLLQYGSCADNSPSLPDPLHACI